VLATRAGVLARGNRRSVWLSLSLLVTACASNPPVTRTGEPDGGAPERDASANELDGGALPLDDAGRPDAGVAAVDAGAPDAGGTDGGTDAGTDAGLDAGRPDAGACGVCVPGASETGAACGMCGTERRSCAGDCTWGAWACEGEGVCMDGEVDTEMRPCGTCGTGMQVRTRTCQSSCTWGAFGDWGACTGDGPCCGDGVCDASETCESCVDCQAGHLGTGTGGASCAGVPAEQWRCVTSTRWSTRVSQVCRDGAWVNFNLDPRDCAACVCGRTDACNAP